MPQPLHTAAPREGGVFPRTTSARILVVEDQHHVREAVVELLALVDYDVLQADSLASAIDLVDQADVVLLDLHLPDGNGLELLELCGELAVPPEVIVITGHGTIDYATRAMHAGAAAFLMKPVQPDDMLMMVGRAAQRRHARLDLQFHRDLLLSVHAVVLAVDSKGHITYFNRAAEDIFARTAADAMGRPIAEMVSPAPLRIEPGDEQEYRYFRSDGGSGTLLARWADIADDGTRRGRRMLVGRDITREKRAELDLVRKGALAEVGTLVADAMSHLSDPATYLTANLTMLKDDIISGDLDPEASIQMLDECMAGIGDLTGSMRRIRDLLRAQVDEVNTRVDLGDVVRTACRVIASTQRGQVEVLVQVGHGTDIFGARGRLMTLVGNLLVEVIASMQDQTEPRPVVRVDVRPADNNVVVELWDNGPGLGDDARALLQGSIGSTDPDAPGLGLAVARAIASEHSGSLHLAEHGGRGTALRLTLPMAPPAEE